MKKLLMLDGSEIEVNVAYGTRLIEQGKAVRFAPVMKAQKAEAPKEEQKKEEPETKETPKKKGK